MKIAITATHNNLDSNVDSRFGRCPYFLIIETDNLNFEAIENPNITLGGGAGIQSAQLLAERGVQHVLTGNCGPNAYQTLTAAGIGIIAGCAGSVREVITRFKAGDLSNASEATVPSHYGTSDSRLTPEFGTDSPTAFAMGGGRGMGGGQGRGQEMSGEGGGRGIGKSFDGPGTPSSFVSKGKPKDNDKMSELRRQENALNQQLHNIQERIIKMGKDSKMIARIDKDSCGGCGACVDACPSGAIQIDDGVAQVIDENCTGCGACAEDCPLGAIQVA